MAIAFVIHRYLKGKITRRQAIEMLELIGLRTTEAVTYVDG